MTGREVVARTAEDGDAELVVAGEAGERVVEGVGERCVLGVAIPRPVERDPGDSPLGLVEDEVSLVGRDAVAGALGHRYSLALSATRCSYSLRASLSACRSSLSVFDSFIRKWRGR